MKRAWVLSSMLVLMGCPQDEEDTIRFGVDATLKELGLGEFIQASYEESSKQRTELIYADTDKLFELASAGKVDTAFVISERALERLDKAGIPIRAETYAHEELMVIGPYDDRLGKHGKASGAAFLENVSRLNYRYLKGKRGSVEHARHTKLFIEGGDAAEPGAWFDTDFEGLALARAAIQKNAFAMVKRSSLLLAAAEGKLPHRIYKAGDPALVLRMVIVEVHPSRTKRPRHPGLYDFITSEEGQKIVASFGVKRFGTAVYAPGAPDPGVGADVPELQAAPAPATP
ncbi:MAG: hypothetical protein RMA76_33255 [Deltaproteobacteria bacterium]